MKFHITLNDEDYIAFRICLCLSTPANKRMFLIGLLKSSIFYCIIFYCFLVFTERDKFTIGIFIALFVVFIEQFRFHFLCHVERSEASPAAFPVFSMRFFSASRFRMTVKRQDGTALNF